MMFLNGFLFMTVKHQALANQEDIFEDHPRMSVAFGIMLFISGSGLGLCAMLGMTQYYSVNDNVTRDWNTPEFITIRREYASHLEAADALKGKFLEVILGYFGLMAFHIQVAVAGWYIFSKHRVEKLVQLKEERTQLASHTNLTLSITSVAACDKADGEAGNATRIEWRRSSACRSRSRRPRGFSIAA